MKQILLLLTVITITLSSCNKRKCYECKLERTNGSMVRIDQCFDKDDRRSYVQDQLQNWENNGYKCRAKLID